MQLFCPLIVAAALAETEQLLECLSESDELRAVFDKAGEVGLKEGIADGAGGAKSSPIILFTEHLIFPLGERVFLPIEMLG